MIDNNGLRANVGIILSNFDGDVLLARRCGKPAAWQFPQGGMKSDETPEQSMFRELYEELGLRADDVCILGVTDDWLTYYLPKQFRRYHSSPLCVGQKQKWFLLQLVGEESAINLRLAEIPEFDAWRWVPYWEPLEHVIEFKREVYKEAMTQLAPLIKKE